MVNANKGKIHINEGGATTGSGSNAMKNSEYMRKQGLILSRLHWTGQTQVRELLVRALSSILRKTVQSARLGT